jgi:ABC-type branched-subunit amino acid transport system substrate-binding protein
MKTTYVVMGVVVAACLAALAVACGGEEEAPTTTATGVATGTAGASPTRAADVPGVSDTEIVLGQHMSISGTLGAVYGLLPQAEKAYFNYINETQGGVCGRKIVLKVEDDQDDPGKGLAAVRKLVEQDKVFAFVGNGGVAAHPAAWEYLNEKGVPDILVAGGIHRFYADPEGHPWTVSAIPDYRLEGRMYGEYISRNLPGKKVGILYANHEGGLDGLAGLKEGLDPEKNELVSEVSFELTDIEVFSPVQAIYRAGAEVLVTHGGPGPTIQAIKAADRMGWKPDAVFVQYTNSDPLLFMSLRPELLEGTITLQAFKLSDWRDDPAVAKHYEIMQKYGGPAPANFTIFSQVIAEVTVEVLSRTCDNLTREGLMDAMESLRDWHSDLAPEGINFTVTNTDHLLIESVRFLRVVVEDGKGKFEYFGPLYSIEGGEVKVVEGG